MTRDPRIPAAGVVLYRIDDAGLERARCEVVAGGFRYAGKIHRSLLAAARACAKDLGVAGRVTDAFAFWGIGAEDPFDCLATRWLPYLDQATKMVRTTDPKDRARLHRLLHDHAGVVLALADSLVLIVLFMVNRT